MSPARNCETFGPAEHQAALDEFRARVEPLKRRARRFAERARHYAAAPRDAMEAWNAHHCDTLAIHFRRRQRDAECAVSRMLGQRWTAGGAS